MRVQAIRHAGDLSEMTAISIMPSSRTSAALRRLQFEQFEQRLVMSAQAVAAPIVELLPELELAAPAITGQEVVWQQSANENASTIASDLAAEYGLDGSGQTVAVIDSGIAWDHYAFGGQFGEGNHVVGGWDFAENDANPYDDGPIGYHGSHVAGIIGSLDDQYKGVASGADLVSLRVFDDSGIGKLEWVEQALRWVHQNKDAFENPITTVNLSLGSGWDPNTTPGWGQLEDELATLKNDGIFISVAAGNYFQQINDVGLSYPAVSEHVVPVASHGSDGQLSDFSQRDDHVLVAPGEMLRSPVPDHLFGGMKTGQFLASTGTSMAAPYVAGVSSVLREANWFMGETEVTQDMLYEQLWATAEQAYDSITGRNYRRIDFEAALDHVISDRFADSLVNATDLGEMNSGDQITGTIGKLNDIDAIKFSATETGRVQLTFSASHELAPDVETAAANLRIDGNIISFDVIAGQSYGFLVGTDAGTGHYQIDVAYDGQVSVPATDLGVIVSNEFTGLKVNQEGGYRVTPVRNGLMSVEALVGPAEQITLEIYDSNGNMIGSTSQLHSVDGSQSSLSRLDVNVNAGEDYFIKFSSDDPQQMANVRVANLVQFDGDTVTVHGTSQQDSFEVSHSGAVDGQPDQLELSVNSFEYSFATSQLDHVRLLGHGGSDDVNVNLSDQNDKVTTRADGVFIGNHSFRLNGFSIESQRVFGGGGYDSILMSGSEGADHFGASQANGQYWTSRIGQSFSSRATGFEVVHAIAGSGDTAELNGTQENETFVSRDGRGTLRLNGISVVADQYDLLTVDGGGGSDRTNLFDSERNDQFTFRPNLATVENTDYRVEVQNFARVNAFATSGGNDSIQLADASGDQNDSFAYRDHRTTLDGAGYTFYGLGFESVHWTSAGGNDLAQIFDTSANDHFRGNGDDAEMHSADVTVRVEGVRNVGFVANRGGYDRVQLEGTQGDDRLTMNSNEIRLTQSNGQLLRVYQAESNQVDLLQGLDRVNLVGSDGRDRLEVTGTEAEFESTMRLLQLTNYDELSLDGRGGRDSVEVEGSIDLLSSLGDRAEMVLENARVAMENISFLEANNVDSALAEYDLESVDFTYMLRGGWENR